MSPTARLGAFMLVALVIIGVFIVKIEDIPINRKGRRARVEAVFPSVAGLDEKSAVRIAGVRVGIVESIRLDGSRALAILGIDPNVQLHQGASAEVSSLGMLGDKYIELHPGRLDAPPLAPGTVLEGTSPVAFDQVLKTANNVGGDLQAVTSSLRKSLGGEEGQKRIDEILDNIRQLTADVRAMVEANRRNVDSTIANFSTFSDTLKTELPKLADRLIALADHVDAMVEENRGNVSGSMENIKELTARLKVSADNINQITGKIASGQGSIGKLVNDDTTVDNLNSTLKSVESGVESLKDTIGRAERWKLDMNVRAESLPKISDSRSTFGLDLHTTDKRFFRVELVNSPVGTRRKTDETITTTYPDGHKETRVIQSEKTTDANTVNAQIGYNLPHDLIVRAGLMESKGGVGVDQGLFDKKLRLTLEAYDFNRDVKPPHLRFETRYFITRNVFAYAGWDDPTWSKQSSVLFGGGVTWLDEDVKYLLGTASAFGH